MGIEREEISFTDWFMRYAKAKAKAGVRVRIGVRGSVRVVCGAGVSEG